MKKLVMVAEDNPIDAGLIKRVVEESEIDTEIIIVENGKDAKDYLLDIENRIPSLLILDWNLVVIHGREILRIIKNSHRLRLIYVIVFTTSDNESDIAEAMRMHANCFAVKPSDYSLLKERLSHALSLWLSADPFFRIPN